jgi:hypothetical protein
MIVNNVIQNMVQNVVQNVLPSFDPAGAGLFWEQELIFTWENWLDELWEDQL